MVVVIARTMTTAEEFNRVGGNSTSLNIGASFGANGTLV